MKNTVMLERTSRFVLEVVPYLLSAVIAAIVVPGFLFSQAHPTKAVAVPYDADVAVVVDQAAPAQLADAAQQVPAYR